MKPRITVITLGVDDLDRAYRFYHDGLELASAGIVGQEYEHGAVAFFDLERGLKLALWHRGDLAHDTGLEATPGTGTDVSLGHNVRTREEVDKVMQQAAAAGAQLVRSARETFWGGYAGYFRDPDGHLWEIVWNPQLLPDD